MGVDPTGLVLGLYRHNGHAIAPAGHAADHDLVQRLVAVAYQHLAGHRVCRSAALLRRMPTRPSG